MTLGFSRFLFISLLFWVHEANGNHYLPNWNSIDSRPLPQWYDEAKFGIFVHWGVFSVPSFGGGVTWFWWDWQGVHSPDHVNFMKNNYRPGFTYPDFGPEFRAEFFNPDEFARIIKSSGAKYMVLISKHHEGFTNWPSNYSWNWNSVDLGPKRNLVAKLVPHKWENCMTIDANSWGFSRSMTYSRVLSIQQLIGFLASTVSCGGNLLMNVGPTHDGRIVPIFEERLNQMGHFLSANGEAVYSTKPWIYQNDTITSNIWYTSKVRTAQHLESHRLYNPQVYANTVVYAFILKWPENGRLTLGAPSPTQGTRISMLGYSGHITFMIDEKKLVVDLSSIPWTELPTTWAWVLKLEFLRSHTRLPDMINPQTVKLDHLHV